jgi:hypothetical protein
MAVPLTPALQAMQAEVAANTPPPAEKVEPQPTASPKSDTNRAWREKLLANGGRVTAQALSPEAVAALQSIGDDSLLGKMSQSQVINTAILRLLGTPTPGCVQLDADTEAAVAAIRTEWGIDNDAEAVSVGLRAFAKLQRNLTRLEV